MAVAAAAASLINVTSHGGAPFKVPFLLSLHHMAQMVAQQFSLSLFHFFRLTFYIRSLIRLQ